MYTCTHIIDLEHMYLRILTCVVRRVITAREALLSNSHFADCLAPGWVGLRPAAVINLRAILDAMKY